MNSPPRILIADDDPVARDLLVEVLEGDGYTTVAAAGGSESVELARRTRFDVALIDLRMPDWDGLKVLETMKGVQPDLPVIIVTAFADMDTAVAAIRAGAYDYLSKPFRMEEIKETVRRTLKSQRVKAAHKQAENKTGVESELLVGKSAAMVAVYKLVARVANNDVTVLITGETGTGKEQVARAIHQASRRAEQPFVAVDCTALPETLFESELFGHERGAFTGAHAQRKGMLEIAGAGTCFLDEIGELSPALQAKLLRALQEKVIRRVGGNQTIPLHARIIAATNHDLPRMVRQGDFREELFYRLNVVNINVPPLRHRREDIPSLVEHFVRKHAVDGTAGPPEIAPASMALLCSCQWPGNVRQLENAIQRAVAIAPSAVVLPEDLPAEITGADAGTEEITTPSMTLNQIKRRHVVEVLEQVGGNKLRAAQILGIDRRTLYRILERTDHVEDKDR